MFLLALFNVFAFYARLFVRCNLPISSLGVSISFAFWHGHWKMAVKSQKIKIMKTLIIIPILALSMVSCKNADKAMTIGDDKQQVAIDSMKSELAEQRIQFEKQKSVDSMKVVMAEKAPAKEKVVRSLNAPAHTVAATAAPAKKKISNTAKGALIGAAAGAVGGAIIDKKKPAQGALIGGLIGAAAGAGTGAIIDAKHKRQGS